MRLCRVGSRYDCDSRWTVGTPRTTEAIKKQQKQWRIERDFLFLGGCFTVRFSSTEHEGWHGAERIVEQVRQERKDIGKPQILTPIGIQQKPTELG